MLLVVDDDDAVCRVTARIPSKPGYWVLTRSEAAFIFIAKAADHLRYSRLFAIPG